MLRMMRALVTLVVRPTFLSFLIAIAISGSAFAQSTVAAGGTHTLVVTSDGRVWSFGFNNFGQLGLDSLDTQTWPQQIPGLTDVQAVAAGGRHSLQLTTAGHVYVWGDNYFNQIGDGSNADGESDRESRRASYVSQASLCLDPFPWTSLKASYDVQNGSPVGGLMTSSSTGRSSSMKANQSPQLSAIWIGRGPLHNWVEQARADPPPLAFPQ